MKLDRPLTAAERKRAERERKQGFVSEVVLVQGEFKAKRRTRSDSTAAMVAAMAAPMSEIAPLPHAPVNQYAMPFWNGIIATRATSDWNDADLSMAAMLAEAQVELALEKEALRLEGSILEFKINPRFSVVEQLTKRITSLMRALKTGNQAAAVTLANARTLEGTARGLMDDPDGLLA